jgi:DNA-directed RNA polymerase subunit H (RpoH/RPB5)
MAIPKDKTFSCEDMIDAVLKRVNIDFKLPKISFYDPRLILNVEVKAKAFPG